MHDHPHASGEDETFRFHHVWDLNVDLARRLIGQGTVEARSWDMPVRDAGRKLLGLPDKLFGAARRGGYGVAREHLGSMAARTLVEVDRLPGLPAASFAVPALLVVWNLAAAEADSAAMRRVVPDAVADRTFPLLVDGNHRLAKAFLDGHRDPLPCLVVEDWARTRHFLSYLGTPVVRTPRPAARGPR